MQFAEARERGDVAVSCILSLDLSKKGTGWAVAPRGALISHAFEKMPLPEGGVWRLSRPGEEFGDYDAAGERLIRNIMTVAAEHDLTAMVCEAPMLAVGEGKNAAAAMIQFGLAMTALSFGRVIGLQVWTLSATTLKKFATGTGHADKPQMVAAARQKWSGTVIDSNHADATHLLDYALHKLDRWATLERASA